MRQGSRRGSWLPADLAIAREDANARAVLWIELVAHANPLPSAEERALGINHKSDREEHAGQLWEPVQALHSNKHFCLRQLEGGPCSQPLARRSQRQRHMIHQCASAVGVRGVAWCSQRHSQTPETLAGCWR